MVGFIIYIYSKVNSIVLLNRPLMNFLPSFTTLVVDLLLFNELCNLFIEWPVNYIFLIMYAFS